MVQDSFFWRIVQQVRDTDAPYDILGRLSAEEITDFHHALAHHMQRANTCLLNGAALAFDLDSEDGFSDFRAWLIVQGQTAFERYLANPDLLAELPTEDPLNDWHYEVLLDATSDVSETTLGKRLGSPWLMDYKGMHGETFEECDEELATRYPRIWKRWGAT